MAASTDCGCCSSGLALSATGYHYGLNAAGAAGLCIFVFGPLLGRLVGQLLGRPWLQAEIFGIAPDPTVVATLGVLIADDRTHWELLIVPLLWCAISGATLWAMQSPDALLIPAAALLAPFLRAGKRCRGFDELRPPEAPNLLKRSF